MIALKLRDILWALLALGVIVVIWYNYPAFVRYIQPELGELSERGQFGDSYGGLNTLFSGLAFLGIIVAIFLQMKELGLQRKELKAVARLNSAVAQCNAIECLLKYEISLKTVGMTGDLPLIAQLRADLGKASDNLKRVASKIEKDAP